LVIRIKIEEIDIPASKIIEYLLVEKLKRDAKFLIVMGIL
jgi:hypothetical protein